MQEITDYIFMVTLFFAALSDILKRKIPNIILLTGTLLFAAAGGMSIALPERIFAALLAFAAVFALYIFRMAGAGDVKLVAFVFFISGAERGSDICLIALFSAGAWAFMKLMASGKAAERFAYFTAYVKSSMSERKIKHYYISERDGREITLPFALFILWGAFICVFSGITI